MEKLMKYFLLFPVIFFSVLIFISCSDLQNDIAPAPELNTHGSGVFSPSASNYHGKQLIDSPNKFEDCKQCHAADFSGGTAKVSCYSSGCHLNPSINVHETGITDTQSSNFHGKFIADKFNGSMISCAQCHGDSYQGGLVSPSCASCHASIPVHVSGIVNPGSPNFHGKYIAANLAWDMRACGSCHAANYSGGIAAPSCLTCHTGTNGPEACNTCHGSFSDPSKIAPPRALNGSTETTYPGVGAHTLHLYENNLGSDISCSTCHKYPQSVYADGHLGNDGKAEIIFGGLSIQGGANPSYNFTNNTCSDSYCHGNFKLSKSSSIYPFAYTDSIMSGNNKTVKWNSVGQDQAECGSCHGLPPIGHVPVSINACVNCHTGIVDVDGNIIDKSKHINGVINVFGN
jgi:hypothetical protein